MCVVCVGGGDHPETLSQRPRFKTTAFHYSEPSRVA